MPLRKGKFPMIRTCSTCGQQNRVPGRHLASKGRCGQCKAELPPLAEPLDVGEAEFREIVRDAKVPVLVDFWAEWCGPCRMAAPQVKRVASDVAGRALVLKVNTDREQRLASEFRIAGIPHFAVLRDGRTVTAQSGLVDHKQMQRWLEQAMN